MGLQFASIAPDSARASGWSRISGPLLTLGAIALIELLSRTSVGLPNLGIALLLVVVYAAFRGGISAGLISVALTLPYYLYYFSIPGKLFHYELENLERLLLLVVVSPAIAVLVGVLQRRVAHMSELLLRRSEERFQKAFQVSPNPMSISTLAEGRYLDVNDSFLRTTGYTREEVVGHTLFELKILANPEDNRRLGRMLKEQGRIYREEVSFRLKSGEIRVALFSAETIEIGGQRCVISITNDVTEQKAAEQRLAMQYAITRVLAESAMISEATPKLIETICEGAGWDLGLFWRVDRQADVLRCAEIWHRPSIGASEFATLSRQIALPRGKGLPGRVWSSGRPVWIVDATKDTNFPRAAVAIKEELHGAFAFPILLGSEIIGVLEFFSRDIQQPDQNLLDTMATASSQIGQFIERKSAEEALRESEDRFRSVAETASDAIIAIDETSTILFVNPAAEKIFGHTTQEMIGSQLTMLMPEYLRHLHRAGLNQYLETGQRHISWKAVELPGLHKSGREIPLELSFAEFTRNGKHYFTGIARDITERKRIEEERAQLLAREQMSRAEAEATGRRYALLAEASRVLASSLDYEVTLNSVAQLAVPVFADWCVVDMLEKDRTIHRLAVAHMDPSRVEMARDLLRQYPYDPDGSHPIMKVLRTGQPEIAAEVSEALLAAAYPNPEQFRIVRELGFKSFMIVPLLARGRVLGAISFVLAESGRRYGPDDLGLAENLARRAALAVDNARLYRESQDANRAKDEFLATLSHELRTPLTPVIGWVHMMRNGMLAASGYERGLAAIDASSQTLARLINDLLDMSAILNGKMRIERSPVALNTVVEEAVETIRPQASKRSINIEAVLCSGDNGDAPVTVSGDRTRLVQVFWNLLYNAVKFSGDGGRVRIVCEADAKEARIHVEDQGQGIAPDFLPHIFERFRQADSSNTRSHGGLGLGLSLVKSFVEAHNGTITVASEGEGSGSRFTVRLPRAPLAASATPPAQGSEAHIEPSNGGTGARLLVIEDALDTLEMLHATLKARGYHVTACESAVEALRIAPMMWFDVIISDIGMPEIDGYELIKRLRQMPHLSDVPAIALTGYAMQRDVEAARAAGFAQHIPKPVDPTELVTRIETMLRRQKSEHEI